MQNVIASERMTLSGPGETFDERRTGSSAPGSFLGRVREGARQRIARSHIAGATLDDALLVARSANRRGWKATICPWGGPADTPGSMSARYLEAVGALADGGYDASISVKIPALGFRPDLVLSLLKTAGAKGIEVRFDALDLASARRSLSIVAHFRKQYPHIALTLPARWLRSILDAETAIDLRIPVRIVKGQWPDPDDPGIDIRGAYLDLAKILAGRAAAAIVATHDRRLAERALGVLLDAGTPCELELMFGLPHAPAGFARAHGVPTRLYIPFGSPSMPYNASDLLHRPAIGGWIIRDLCVSGERKAAKIL